MAEVELTEDDKLEQDVCDDMFPDDWLEKEEEEKFQEDVDLLEQFIRMERVFSEEAAASDETDSQDVEVTIIGSTTYSIPFRTQ